ncbi:hypothetical protein [Lentilactobacillus parafarraginis]|nr:hypothetical protein [Lentilactobacillus parafarraginis]
MKTLAIAPINVASVNRQNINANERNVTVQKIHRFLRRFALALLYAI